MISLLQMSSCGLMLHSPPSTKKPTFAAAEIGVAAPMRLAITSRTIF